MALHREANGQLAKSGSAGIEEKKKPKTTQQLLESPAFMAQLKMALPRHLSPEKFCRMAMTAVTREPKLLKCTQDSFFGALFNAATIGLEPNTPLHHCVILPYGNEAQLIIEYRGMMELSRRSGEMSGASFWAEVVRKGDEFEVEYGLHRDLKHKKSEHAEREKQPCTHVYACAQMKDNSTAFVVLTAREVATYQARSPSEKANKGGPWRTDWEAMAKKTAVRRLWTWLPQSTEIAHAIELDEAVERGSQRSAYDPVTLEMAAALEIETTPEADLPAESDNAEQKTSEQKASEQAQSANDTAVISADQIRGLKREAIEAGRRDLVEICDNAIKNADSADVEFCQDWLISGKMPAREPGVEG